MVIVDNKKNVQPRINFLGEKKSDKEQITEK